MPVNKFPKVYHEGALDSNNPLENRAYSIYTEQNEASWNNDSGIDFYTFHDDATDTDSPQTSYSLLVIKNTGEANSLLDITTLQIDSPAGFTGPYQPFSIITAYNQIGTSGTTNLHTTPSLPPTIELNDGTGGSTIVNYGTSGTNYAALNPAPIGYVKMISTSGTIENLNDGVEAVTGDDFGSTGVLRYIPFYDPADIIQANNAIGVTNTNYGTGALDYPHYCAILIKCDPSIPLQITSGQVQLTVSNGINQTIVIDLIMQSYNTGNFAFQQGWLYKHGNFGTAVDSSDPEMGDTSDQGEWTYEPHIYYSLMDHNGGPDNSTGNTPMIPSGSNTPYPISGDSEVPAYDSNIPLTSHLFMTPRPRQLHWNNKNNFLANNAGITGTNTSYEDKKHCIRMYDETTYSGGIQWYNPDDSQIFLRNGKVNNHSSYVNENQTDYIMKGVRYTSIDGVDVGAWCVASDTILASIGNPIISFSGNPNTSNNLNSGLRTLGPTQYLYLIVDTNDGLVDLAVEKLIHRAFGYNGTLHQNATFPNAVDINGRKAFRWNITTYPFFWKPFYVNDGLNGITQKISFNSVQGVYDNLGMAQGHSWRFGNSYQTNSDGIFDDGQPAQVFKNNNEIFSFSAYKARTHADSSNKYVGLHSYAYGVDLGSNTYQGIVRDAATNEVFTRSFANAVENGPQNTGWHIALKHTHIADLFQLPKIQMTEVNEFIAGNHDTAESVVHPTIAWTVMLDFIYDNTTTNMNAFCSFFPWTNTVSDWNSNQNISFYNGSTELTGEFTRPITKTDFEDYHGIESAGLNRGFIPNGFRVQTTAGDESVADNSGIAASGTGSLETSVTDIFSNVNTFESITVGGLAAKQKVLKLATLQLPDQMSNNYHALDHWFHWDDWDSGNQTPNIGQLAAGSLELVDLTDQDYQFDYRYSGDKLGRFVQKTTFTLHSDRMVNFAKTRNDVLEGNYNSEFGPNTRKIKFSLWGYQWPKLHRGYTALMKPGAVNLIGAGMPGLTQVDNFYLTRMGQKVGSLSAPGAWTIGQTLTESMLELCSQDNTKYSGTLPAGTFSAGATMHKFKYASKTRADHGYWKRLPHNGRSVFKQQKWLSEVSSTARKVSFSGSENSNDAYGILPGPRKVGRIDANGNWEKVWTFDKYMYHGTTNYNSNVNRHECFIPINVGIDPEKSDYSIQLVNIHLENEMLKPGGSANQPTTRTLSEGDPLYRWDQENDENLTEDYNTPELHDKILVSNVAKNMAEFQVPIVDVQENPQVNESHELHPIVRTAPISNVRVHNVTLDPSGSAYEFSLTGGIIKTYHLEGASTEIERTIGSATNYTVASSGIQIGMKVYQIDASGAQSGALVQASDAHIVQGCTVIDIQDNNIQLSDDMTNTSTETGIVLIFQMPQPNYATWAITRGKRGVNENVALYSLPRSNVNYRKYCELFVQPHNSTYNPQQWYEDATWTNSGAANTITKLSYLRLGKIGKALPNTNQSYSDFDGNTYQFRRGTLWHNWRDVAPQGGGQDVTFFASGVSKYFPSYMNDEAYANFEIADIGQGSPVNVPTRHFAGAPHICLSIDHNKALANKLEEGVFYNRVFISYIVNNKLDMYGLDQERISHRWFNDPDNNDDTQDYSQGGAQDACIYQDSFLVKVSYDASIPTLVVHDLEGDAVDTGDAINFGTLNSD